jgi:hypothetical protein
MEGDSATGTHVIPKYLELKELLTKKIADASEAHSLYPMYQAMLKRVEKYLAEALQCETLVLATLMHPCYRVHLFELAFGADSIEVTEVLRLLHHQFKRAKDQKAAVPVPTDLDVMVINEPVNFEPDSLMHRLASRYMAQQPTTQDNEIEAYMKANITIKADDLAHKTTPLRWWKVSNLNKSQWLIYITELNCWACFLYKGPSKDLPHAVNCGEGISWSTWKLMCR